MDLSSLNALLAGLGPWGILIGVGLTVLAQWARNRAKPAPTPEPSPLPFPLPAPGPSPQPSPQPAKRPVIDAMAQLLALLFAKKHAPEVYGELTDAEAKFLAAFTAEEPPAEKMGFKP